jgi:drug/metabolite transporter (DMT)-like permease
MQTRSVSLPAEASIARGIAFAILSYACFSTSDAIVKLASGGYSVFQIAATLGVFALVPVPFLTIGMGGLRALRPRLPGLVATRAVLTAIGALCAWEAFARLPLTDAYAILFGAPILVTALSHVILGEQVGWRRWSASGVGFIGVLIMIRPGFTTLGMGHALAAAAAVVGSFSFIVLRRIGSRDTSAAILLMLFLVITGVSLPLAIRDFIMPSGHDLLLQATAGLLQGGGQAVLVLATRSTPASIVAPFQYSQMGWALLYGLVLFGNRPQPVMFIGLAIGVASGIYIVWRETVRRVPVTIGAGRGETPARAAREVPPDVAEPAGAGP